MIRTTGLAAVVALALGGAVQADDAFDATGQFFFSFDFSVTGKEDVKPRFGVRFGSSSLDGVQGNNDARLDSNYGAIGLSFDGNDSALSVGHARINLGEDMDPNNVVMSPTAEPLYPMRGTGSHFDAFSAPRVRDKSESFALEAIHLEPAGTQRAQGVFETFKSDPSISGID